MQQSPSGASNIFRMICRFSSGGWLSRWAWAIETNARKKMADAHRVKRIAKASH
ncbi:hypothetical protein M5C96_14800 [Acidovorax sp. GBBC 1281]|nr:hypothetical protein M5C96_14800 [Acidovorax sp. GBBC 1281]